MNTKLFINLPVKNLPRSVAFFTSLGFSFNAQFTDENATCMIINSDAFVMLLVEDFFKNFTPKRLSDANKMTEVLVSISVDSREKVDELVNKAFEAGAKFTKQPEDLDNMYGWGFQDLDGHIWEVIYMDESSIQKV
jgi:predicted lactoylglutathione lyase